MTLLNLQRACRRSLVLALLLCVAGSGAASEADRRLDAIKQALVDLSLGSELRLATSAYVDERGVLHESSLVTSQAQIRGVRVLAYLQEAGMTTASLEAAMATSECAVKRPGLKRQVLVSVDHGLVDPRLGGHYLSEIAALARHNISSELSGSSSWSVVQAQTFASRYHQKMAASAGSQPPLELQISLREEQRKPALNIVEMERYISQQGAKALFWSGSKIPAIANRQPWPSQLLSWNLRLIDPVLGEVILVEEGKIDYPSLQRGYHKAELPVQFVQQLSAVSTRFVARADEVLKCQAPYYHVSAGARPADDDSNAGKRMKINAGSVAGVQVGDQFLLSRTPQITGRGARLNDIEDLVLAEVSTVSPQSATLVAVAGQAAKTLTNYVAIHF